MAAIACEIWGQRGTTTPRFEGFPVAKIFTGTPAQPTLASPEERRFRTTISQGVSKGYGVEDGTTGQELATAGPNFAGHYVIVRWGCGSPCLMMAIVDSKTGRVFPPPFHHGPGDSYFQLPWDFPLEPLRYRLDSRLLIANICESDKTVQIKGEVGYQARRCGSHYFVMGDSRLTLIYKVLDQ